MTLFIFFLLAIVITRTPIVGSFFILLNTMIHETGHVLMTFLTKGEVHSVSLFSNTEGLAITGYRSLYSKILIGLSGYTFSSFFSYCLVILFQKGLFEVILYLLLSIACLNFFWIKNGFGFVWLMTMMTFLVIMHFNVKMTILPYLILFLIVVILVDSVRSACTIFYLSIVHRKQAGDATMLSQSTYIPTIIWGLFFFVQSLFFAYLSITQF